MSTQHYDNLTVFGTPEDGAVEQIMNCLNDERAVKGALMADNHKGYSMPIGGVVAYEGAISPTGVGFDIACGNKAVKTNFNIFDLGVLETSNADGEMVVDPTVLKPLMREIQKKVAFGIGRSNSEPVDHALFDSPVWLWLDSVSPGLKKKAADQLGTVGSGNHYVDLLVGSRGKIWVANHFGSRGLGHTIASGFFAIEAGLNFTDRVSESEHPVVFATDSEIGAHYIACMELAGQYAYAGRDYVINQVLDILGAKAVAEVHNHHNYAWLEDGLWVVRKGATPLTREPAFIGGSMGDISVIVKGAPIPEGGMIGDKRAVIDIGNICSAPHGAGRVMSRTAAAGKLRKMWVCTDRGCDFKPIRAMGDGSTPDVIEHEHKLRKVRMRDPETAGIDWDATRASLKERGIVVLGAGADEAPGVYKDLATVLAAHSNIQIIETLRPIGVVMAGADEFDPYKD